MINTSVMNSGGVDKFYAIWYTLNKYENKIGMNKANR